MPRTLHQITETGRSLLRALVEPKSAVAAVAPTYVDDIVSLSSLGLITIDVDGELRVTPKGIAAAKETTGTP